MWWTRGGSCRAVLPPWSVAAIRCAFLVAVTLRLTVALADCNLVQTADVLSYRDAQARITSLQHSLDSGNDEVSGSQLCNASAVLDALLPVVTYPATQGMVSFSWSPERNGSNCQLERLSLLICFANISATCAEANTELVWVAVGNNTLDSLPLPRNITNSGRPFVAVVDGVTISSFSSQKVAVLLEVPGPVSARVDLIAYRSVFRLSWNAALMPMDLGTYVVAVAEASDPALNTLQTFHANTTSLILNRTALRLAVSYKVQVYAIPSFASRAVSDAYFQRTFEEGSAGQITVPACAQSFRPRPCRTRPQTVFRTLNFTVTSSCLCQESACNRRLRFRYSNSSLCCRALAIDLRLNVSELDTAVYLPYLHHLQIVVRPNGQVTQTVHVPFDGNPIQIDSNGIVRMSWKDIQLQLPLVDFVEIPTRVYFENPPADLNQYSSTQVFSPRINLTEEECSATPTTAAPPTTTMSHITSSPLTQATTDTNPQANASSQNPFLTIVAPAVASVILVLLLVIALLVVLRRRHQARVHQMFKRASPAFPGLQTRFMEVDIVPDIPSPMDTLARGSMRTRFKQGAPSRWETSMRNVDLITDVVLGEGAFGKVVLGHLLEPLVSSSAPEEETLVAVKEVKYDQYGSRSQYAEDCLKNEVRIFVELQRDGALSPHIVRMLYYLREPVHGRLSHIVMELLPFGSLLALLRAGREGARSQHYTRVLSMQPCLALEIEHGSQGPYPTMREAVGLAVQVCKGMEFMAAKHFVHRDLRAKNVLVGEGKLLKICDFGMTRDVYTDDAYISSSQHPVPTKWMSPETLNGDYYTPASDVWSFGVLLWEICTLGYLPYPEFDNNAAELLAFLKEGGRSTRPFGCMDELDEIMNKCWEWWPDKRPSFARLTENLTQIIESSGTENYVQAQADSLPGAGESSLQPLATVGSYYDMLLAERRPFTGTGHLTDTAAGLGIGGQRTPDMHCGEEGPGVSTSPCDADGYLEPVA